MQSVELQVLGLLATKKGENCLPYEIENMIGEIRSLWCQDSLGTFRMKIQWLNRREIYREEIVFWKRQEVSERARLKEWN